MGFESVGIQTVLHSKVSTRHLDGQRTMFGRVEHTEGQMRTPFEQNFPWLKAVRFL